MPSADNQPSRFVFQDPRGQRWPRLRRVLAVWAVLVTAGLIWFIWSLFVRPEFRLPLALSQHKGRLGAAQKQVQSPPDDAKVSEPKSMLNTPRWVVPSALQVELAYSLFPGSEWLPWALDAQDRLSRGIPAENAPQTRRALPKEIRLGFYVDWDPNAWPSLQQHANSLTHIAPEWLTLLDSDGYIGFEPEPRLSAFAAAHGIAVMPLLTNLAGDTWQPEAVENLARAGLDQRNRFIADLIGKLKRAKCRGVIIDWEQLDPTYTADYTNLIVQMAEALHHVDLEIWLLVSPGEDFTTFDLEALQLTVDQYVAVLHDENSASDPPGAIASLPWMEEWLKVMEKLGEPGQWVGVLGAYAYDWSKGTKSAEAISFKDAMTRASFAGADQSATPVLVGAKGYNGNYSYYEGDTEHEVYFLDAISFSNQLKQLRSARLGGVGIFRLGTEDPHIWEVLENPGPPRPTLLKALQLLKSGDTITHVGRGEIVSVDDSRNDGRRNVDVDEVGLLRARYIDFPTYPSVYHQGAANPHQVAITFDDGPDPEYTPQILRILREKGLKACFFLVGKNAEDYPELVARIVAEGHEIGNHTYNHRNLALLPPMVTRLELNMTQRVIESITGRSTTLFRPPYNADSNPSTVEDLIPLKIAEQEHYISVLEQIDPQDWARPGVDEIVQRVEEQRKDGNIVLLHDAGGDRSQTVEALPRIIDYLETRGDHIVPISTLIGVTRDELMPPLKTQSVDRIVTTTGFRVWHAIIGFFWSFMIFATAVVFVRTLLVAWLARRHFGGLTKPGPLVNAPGVSVVIAAFNESRVIAKTLRSVLDTDYPGEIEVIVVDDGSQDGTAEVVDRLAAYEPRLVLLRQPNRGKSLALRNGVAHARHGLVAFLDADTQFERGTISALIAPFSHPLVGAVSGNARVGNLRTFITRCQSLEYICGFNLDRRAYTEWNCITVVPGAVSAFRKSAIAAAGGFSHDTLAEDTDLTLTLHRLRYRIEFAPDAIAWTEAPESLRTLAKQRFRWAFGTMQCLWKHRDLVLNPQYGALGWFSLPNIWFFQIGLVAVTPLVDAILLWSIFFGGAAVIWYYFVIFLLLELFLSALACRMEGEPMRRAWISIPMRLIYRPLLAWVVWHSILRALKGALVGWGKLERTASVPSRA